MLIGYARVSTSEQSLDLQLDALNALGCEKIFSDVASGAMTARPGLDEALTYLRKSDTLVVWKLDRLGRSLQHLIQVVTKLHEEEKSFKSLQESLDSSTSAGKLIFHVFGALAEFERDIIRDRTKAGLTAARARGRYGGRPRVMNKRKIAMAKALLADANNTVDDVCSILKISRSSLYAYIKPYWPCRHCNHLAPLFLKILKVVNLVCRRGILLGAYLALIKCSTPSRHPTFPNGVAVALSLVQIPQKTKNTYCLI